MFYFYPIHPQVSRLKHLNAVCTSLLFRCSLNSMTMKFNVKMTFAAILPSSASINNSSMVWDKSHPSSRRNQIFNIEGGGTL